MFIDWYLPGYRAGGPIRSCANMIEHLKDDLDFSVVTSDTDYHETRPYPGIRSNEWTVLPDKTRIFYFSKDKLTAQNIRKILDEEKYDCVYLNGIFSKMFTLVPLLYFKKQKQKRVIIASRGMFAKGALSVKPVKKKFFLLYARMTRLFSGVTFHASSEQEKKDIMQNTGAGANVYVAPNLPRKAKLDGIAEKIKAAGELKLICLSRISPEKNTRFAVEAVAELKGNVTLDIYGTVNNKTYWEECQALIRKLPQNIRVNYAGSLPGSEVLPVFRNYHFLLMPSLGENFGHSILESLMTATPVIISDQTMWKGLEVKKAGFDIPLRDRKRFISTLQKCVGMGGDEYRQWSAGALVMARSFIANDSAARQNRELFSNT